MKKAILFAVIFVAVCINGNLLAYSGGTGDTNSPYQIGSVTDWQSLMANSGDWGKSFVMVADVNLAGVSVTPVGNSSVPFSGRFDGDGHVITNLTINSATLNYIGVFGYTSNALISNIYITSARITGTLANGGQYAGSLSGCSYYSTIVNCKATGTVSVSSTGAAGGLIGYVRCGDVNDCNAVCTVNGRIMVGGLIGAGGNNSSGALGLTVKNCSAQGTVNGWGFVGGLIGGVIIQSGSAGNILVSESRASAAVTGTSNSSCVGGLLGGINYTIPSGSVQISNCYATGTVTAGSNSSYVGGLIGGNSQTFSINATITNSYSMGAVTVGTGGRYVGGFVGGSGFTCTACFWDTETSGKTSSSGGRGLTSSQMKSMSVYQAAGWGNGEWVMNDEVDYPRLAWENTGGTEISAQPIPLLGSGSQEDPYQIWNNADFASLSWYTSVLDKHIALMTDLDLNGVSLYPIGDLGSFTGTFDGAFHVIRNATISRSGSSNVGLFGTIGSGSVILNLGVESISITGTQYVGALVAYNSGGTVQNSYATGSVSGTSGIGGLIGYNKFGTVSNCYAIVATSGNSTSNGGLIGTNSYGVVSYCYSAGAVGRTTPGGGLIGTCDGNVAVKGCVWDKTASGQAGSDAGKGLTSSQMKSMAMYQNFGWANHGWIINDGVDYPRLAWQNTTGIPIPEAGTVPLTGDGNQANPFQITTPADLAVLNWYASVLDKHISLACDLDLAGLAVSPIGELGPFTGIFEGNGHAIRNLDVNTPAMSFVGLFGAIGSGGEISNLKVESAKINGNQYCGTVAGYCVSGQIYNCQASGSVKGISYLGGLVGRSSSCRLDRCVANSTITGSSSASSTGGLIGYSQGDTIRNCHAEGSVSAGSSAFYTGGLVGYCSSGIIDNCYATGNIIAHAHTGGLIGNSTSGEVNNCWASGNVSGEPHVGGLIGYGHANAVRSCYAMGNVTGGLSAGGLIGSNSVDALSDCYARGNVSGSSWVGGLIGDDHSSGIERCYSTGVVTGTSSSTVGGLIGDTSSSTITGCFWDVQHSGKSTSAGGTGLSTAEMKAMGTFTAAGWDFIVDGGNGTAGIWRMCVDGISYPRLTWEFSGHGDFVCPDGVRFEDFAVLAKAWLSSSGDAGWNGSCDISVPVDGTIDNFDLMTFADHWLEGVQ